MKNRFLNISSLFLALLMLLPLLASCSGDNRTDTPSGESETPTEKTEVTTAEQVQKNQPDKLNIIQDGKTDYVIVRSMSAKSWEVELSKLFCNTVEALTGVTIPVIDDFESEATGDKRREKEIVFGTTNRENEYNVDYDAIGDGYKVFVSYERLIFASKSETGLYKAILKFFENYFALDLEKDTPKRLSFTDFYVSAKYLSMDIFKSGIIPYIDADFSDYTVAYESGNYMQKRMSVVVANALTSATGVTLNRMETNTPSETSFVLCDKKKSGENLGKGLWEIDVDGKIINIRASDYYGFGGAATYLKTALTHGHYDFKDGFTVSGDYTSSLDSVSASTKYAYNRAGDNRILFYNALWGDSADSYTFKTSERNTLQAEMIEQYMPDVIGFQEFDVKKRSGNGSLASLLSELGYTETISSGVSNTMKINYTPLYYNTNTVTLIKSEFYWYVAQDSTAYDNDKSSKALTWGVFESKKTGDRYIVISTHMCTKDDTVRGQQASEALTVIANLVSTYACPVFIGGDFNGTYSSANYKAFTEGGLTDVRKSASVTTNICTHTVYPNYNSTLGMIRPTGVVGVTDSIDHIMTTNNNSVKLNLFGVIADECTRSASDHLPIFVDFSIATSGEDEDTSDYQWSKRY